MIQKNWTKELDYTINKLGVDGDEKAYLRANADMVFRVVRGQGPDDDEANPGESARCVCNRSSVHIPEFCSPPAGEKAYKNGYDLGKHQVGDGGEVPRRRLVDSSLPIAAKDNLEVIYFGANEINGSGVRFYGDLCLVVEPDKIDPDTTILDRNSYDLLRPPISNRLNPSNRTEMTSAALKLAGIWGSDTGYIAAIKVLERLPFKTRRLTTGLVSDAVLEDEDYIEVLRIGTLAAGDLEEVRSSADDTAAELQIAQKLRSGMTPSAASLLWHRYRRDAGKSLHKIGREVRTVTTTGRVRS